MNNTSPWDSLDLRIAAHLQQDASLSNQALAQSLGISPATCLRRIRRLQEEGLIERTVAILSPERLQKGVTALLEISLDRQSSEALEDFERHILPEAAVQQCYRVAGGADFVLVIHVSDMETYHTLAHRLFSSQANVRNVRTFFSTKRAKFSTEIALSEC